MRRLIHLAVLGAGLAAVFSATASAEPITKQVGRSPALGAFQSICAVVGYADYGECGGDTTKFTDLKAKVNAIQATPGIYGLGISFAGLDPGESYTLRQNLNGVFSPVGTAVTDSSGALGFEYAITLGDHDQLAWDLNRASTDTTILTTYWAGLALSPEGQNGRLRTHGMGAMFNDDTASPSTTWSCQDGGIGGTNTVSSVGFWPLGTQVLAVIHLDGALANATFDAWVEQTDGTCPPGTSSPSNPAVITTDANGDGVASITVTPVPGATKVWMTLWAPAGSLTGTQVLRTPAIPFAWLDTFPF